MTSSSPLVDPEIYRKVWLAKQIELEEQKLHLPHLYSFKWYEWAWDFFTSTNKTNLLCAANQISKSSTMIRKCIHWATETSLWPSLWSRSPNQFWYMYPSKPVLEAEFKTKWKEFLPRGPMKDHPQYGWKEMRQKGELSGVEFNTGVIVFFKVYSQKVTDLQAGSVYAMFCDEEMPIHLYDELINRMNATNGYFHMAFTATLGQEFWRRALEPKETEKEELVGGWKRQISLYDSMKYSDGTASQWTEERISDVKARCKTHMEILRRVFGKFILVQGRKYPEFDASRHMKKVHPIPEGWFVYVGQDSGSGGEDGHMAALCYVAVRPDFKAGRVFSGWRGDGVVTDSSYVVRKHIEIKEQKKLKPVAQYYDWSSKEFFIVAQGMGENFIPADKGHDSGEKIINTLFKNDMLYIYETEELAKLANELSSLRAAQNKRKALDDLSDALRYAVSKIPWDFSDCKLLEHMPVAQIEEVKLSYYQQQIKDRREQMSDEDEVEKWPNPLEEMEEWNELAGDG